MGEDWVMGLDPSITTPHSAFCKTCFTPTQEDGGEQITAPQNGDLATPTDNAAADTRENGVEETLPADGGNQREIQSFNSLIPETSKRR